MITAKNNIIETTFYCKKQIDFNMVRGNTEEVYDIHMDVHIQHRLFRISSVENAMFLSVRYILQTEMFILTCDLFE